jgi:hypothetical protein
MLLTPNSAAPHWCGFLHLNCPLNQIKKGKQLQTWTLAAPRVPGTWLTEQVIPGASTTDHLERMMLSQGDQMGEECSNRAASSTLLPLRGKAVSHLFAESAGSNC